jgi:hypothetical protein
MNLTVDTWLYVVAPVEKKEKKNVILLFFV